MSMYLLLVVAATALGAIKTIYFTADTYTASGVLYVSSKSVDNTTKEDEVNKGDIDTARTLSTTYIETLKIRAFLMDVSDAINNRFSYSEISKMIQVSAINNTELLSIKVTAETAQDAYDIAKNLVSLAPKKLAEVNEGGSIKIIDQVLKPTTANDSGLFKNCVIGGMIGFILAIAIVFLIAFFDKKVRRSEDVAKRYEVSILGVLNY